MKQTYLVLFLLEFLILGIRSDASDTTSPTRSLSKATTTSQIPAIQSISIIAGPLKPQQLALLLKIQKAQELGVATQGYMTSLLDIENMVRQGAAIEIMQSRLDSINCALTYQLSQNNMNNSLGTSTKVEISKNLMPLEKARLYVLNLVNIDRARYHLSPLTLDTTASFAGQLHTDEMAAVGYGSHWNTAGKKPTQRYTEAGGMHNNSENIAYLWSNRLRSRDRLFAAEDLLKMQSFFMIEKAPRDGHRLQILKPEHNKLGVGLSSSLNVDGETRLCLAQEFLDQYGEYSPLPGSIDRSKSFDVSGSFFPGLTLDRVSIAWEPAPTPKTKEELLRTHSYVQGDCSVADFYSEFKSDTVKVWTNDECQHFSVRIGPEESWKPGLYYVSIWAKSSKFNRPIKVSTRTTRLDLED